MRSLRSDDLATAVSVRALQNVVASLGVHCNASFLHGNAKSAAVAAINLSLLYGIDERCLKIHQQYAKHAYQVREVHKCAYKNGVSSWSN